ncbi:MAG: M28 family peptidase [Desulfurococcaceae archaeon]|jgi:Iap family predicted aminopeptidase|nr:M28 family peptidase [Desulfurococcaceae archaeon]
MDSIARNVISLASSLTRFGDVIAGTSREKQVIEIIKMFVENYVDNIVIEPVEVLSWTEDLCVIEIDGVLYRCSLHPPYSGSTDTEVMTEDIVFVKRFSDIAKLSKTIEDKVVVIEDIEDPNYVAVYSYVLRSFNPVAIVFIDRMDTLRRIVSLDDVISRYSTLPPPKIPAIHIAYSTGLKLRSMKSKSIRITARSSLDQSYGFNILAEVNGKDVGTIYLTAHHDKWFNSLVDDSLGIAVLVNLVSSKILEKLAGVSITLAFFTAEEGFPNPLSSFYWLVGSRYHVVKNIEKIFNEVGLVINLDVIYGNKVRFSTSNLLARGMLMRIGVDDKDIEHDSMLFDSFSFTLIGLPSITIHNYYDIVKDGIYHSTLDSVDLIHRIDLGLIDNIVNKIYVLVKMYHEIYRGRLLRNVLGLGVKTLVKELALGLNTLENLFYLHKIIKGLLDCDDYSKVLNTLQTLHRIITSAYIPKSIYRGEEIYEKIFYMMCLDDVVYLPQGIEMGRDECYRRILYDLELLTYILRC